MIRVHSYSASVQFSTIMYCVWGALKHQDSRSSSEESRVFAEGTHPHTPAALWQMVSGSAASDGSLSSAASFLCPVPCFLLCILWWAGSAHLHPRLCGYSAGACRSVTQIIEQPAAVTAWSPRCRNLAVLLIILFPASLPPAPSLTSELEGMVAF